MLQFFQAPENYDLRIDKSEDPEDIPFEQHITIYKETKLKMNHEGCSNSLSEECTTFHRDFGIGVNGYYKLIL